MRQLNTQEVQTVAGAGLLTSTLGTAIRTGAAAGKAVGSGVVALGKGTAQAGAIVVRPLATGAVTVLRILI